MYMHNDENNQSCYVSDRFLFYNFVSCLASHPDETLKKRLKEKRKGDFMLVFIIALAHPSPVLHVWA